MSEANGNVTAISEATIERLRASRQKSEEKAGEAGEDDGRKWASNTAEAEELSRLEGLYDPHNWDITDGLPEARDVYYGMHSEDDGDWQSADEFWENVADLKTIAPINHCAYVRGFVEGALEVWEEVKDAI